MNVVWLVVAASALLGLATGLGLRVWAMVPVSLAVALVSAWVANSQGFGFTDGVLAVMACLFVCQAAYIAVWITGQGPEKFLADDAIDDKPDDDREDGIGDK